MILGRHGQPLDRRIERGSLRDRPRFHDAIPLQAKVVVERGGSVLLHDPGELVLARPGHLSARLGRRRSGVSGGNARAAAASCARARSASVRRTGRGPGSRFLRMPRRRRRLRLAPRRGLVDHGRRMQTGSVGGARFGRPFGVRRLRGRRDGCFWVDRRRPDRRRRLDRPACGGAGRASCPPAGRAGARPRSRGFCPRSWTAGFDSRLIGRPGSVFRRRPAPSRAAGLGLARRFRRNGDGRSSALFRTRGGGTASSLLGGDVALVGGARAVRTGRLADGGGAARDGRLEDGVRDALVDAFSVAGDPARARVTLRRRRRPDGPEHGRDVLGRRDFWRRLRDHRRAAVLLDHRDLLLEPGRRAAAARPA